MKQILENALFGDCETDEERAKFFRSGRAWETGVVSFALAPIIAEAFWALARIQALGPESSLEEAQFIARNR